MGLSYLAEAKGGYPTGYNTVAQTKSVFGGVKFENSDKLTFGEGFRLIENTLSARLTEENPLDGDRYDNASEVFMTRRLKIMSISGTVSDNGATALGGKSMIRRDEIKISELVLKNFINEKELLGRRVKAYYKYNEDSGKNELLYIRFLEHEIITIDAEAFEGFENRKYTYKNNNDRIISLSLESDFILIYNNMALIDGSLFSDSVMLPENGYVTLLDNDLNGRYDIAFVKSYQTIVVSEVDTENNKIYDFLGNPPVILGDDSENYKITNKNGDNISLKTAAMHMNVLSVAQDLEKKHTEVIMSNDIIKGQVTETSEYKGRDVYVISDNEYVAVPECKQQIRVSDAGTFYLTHNSKIAYVKHDRNADIFIGILMGAQISTDIDSGLSLKIYSEENILKTVKFSENAIIDGSKINRSYNYVSDFESLVSNNKNLIRYKLNKDSEITWLDTVIKGVIEEGESLNISEEVNGIGYKIYRPSTQTIGKTMGVDQSTKIIILTDPLLDDQIIFTDVKFYKTSKKMSLTTTAYRLGDSRVTTAIVEQVNFIGFDINNIDGDGGDSINAFGLIDGISKAVYNDESVYKLSLINHDGTRTYINTSNAEAISFSNTGIFEAGQNLYSLEKGDIIRYGYNKQGSIDAGNVLCIYDESRGWYRNEAPYNLFEHREQLILDVVPYEKESDWLFVANVDPDITTVDEIDNILAFRLSMFNIRIVDRATKKITTGFPTDVLTYKEAGNNCSDIILYTNYGDNGGMIVIYR